MNLDHNITGIEGKIRLNERKEKWVSLGFGPCARSRGEVKRVGRPTNQRVDVLVGGKNREYDFSF